MALWGFIAAAVFEIAGCWFMLKFLEIRDYANLMASIVALAAFAMLVSIVDVGAAGRTYAIYGGIYIATAFAFFWFTDGPLMTKWDVIGVILSLIGAAVIMLGAKVG